MSYMHQILCLEYELQKVFPYANVAFNSSNIQNSEA